jgi:hypothetical protein
MSFYTGTQCELLYAMPTSATAVTAAATTVLSGSTAANPAYQLPNGYFQQQSGSGAGRSMLIKGGGWFTTSTTTQTTAALNLYFTTTAGSTSSAIKIGGTGSITTGTTAVTDGIFMFEMLLTATAPGFASTQTTINAVGNFDFGGGNNAEAQTYGTFPANTTGFAWLRALIGAPQASVSITPTTTYYIEPFWTWTSSTGSPTMTLTNYFIFGLN